jgi:hypothetical protein
VLRASNEFLNSVCCLIKIKKSLWPSPEYENMKTSTLIFAGQFDFLLVAAFNY